MAVIDVIFGDFVDLDGGVLGVNLALNERLKDFWYPNVEANLTFSGDDFEAEVFLDAARVFELGFVS